MPGSRHVPERAHILVVDDDPDFAESLGELLRLEGYSVAIAHDQQQALRAAAEALPAVALLDVRLGIGNGVDLLRALHAEYPDLIAVMVTAYATVEASVEALQAGAYDYLRKPFLTDDLLATLARCLERRRLLEERQQAVTALQARNRELEALNARLARVLGSLGELSRAPSSDHVAHRLFGVLTIELEAEGAALYRRRDGSLQCEASTGAALPDRLDWPTAAQGAQLAFPVEGDDAGVLAAVALRRNGATPFSRQDAEIGQILASFGSEVMRAARAREDLARSEQRLRDVVQNSPSAIALKDLQGSYLLVNERFAEWFGPDREGSEPEAMADATVVGLGRAVTSEIDLTPGSRNTRRLLVTRFPVLDSTGRPIGIGTIGTDVTERHEAEERLRQAQRMEALGQLTGGVAHDFNNLLAVVLGNLMLIEEQCRSRPDLLEMIEDALDATRSGVELTGRLLAFGRRQPLHPESTDLREQVLGISRLLGRTLGERISIRLELTSDPSQVHVDRNQLEASLLNLALNARDAMPDGGALTIAVEEVELDIGFTCADHAIEPNRYVALSVSDIGHGMDEEVRQRAVQPFFTTKPAGAGSGLGLSMAYGFVHQSGGHLMIDSAPGRGTSVTLYFPIASAGVTTAPARLPATEKTPEAHGECVLLVEDQPKVRLLLRRQLMRLGYVVVDVADARAALERLDDPRIEVLLTDIVLPGDMDGVRLGEAALARRPELALVLTTGYAAGSLAVRTGDLAAAPILRKPFAPEELARALRRALDRQPEAQPRAGANI
jgi:signal transduction histidine kinase/DNA-binding response OmpR family regulator